MFIIFIRSHPEYASLWLWAINYEFNRSNRNAYHIGGLFERCFEGPLKNNSHLWRMYVKVCIDDDDLRKAKMVYYRGVRECVYNKKMYMYAFEDGFRMAFDNDELAEIITLMEEKEIRLYHTI